MTDDVRWLQEISILKNLTEDEARSLLSISRLQHAPTDEVIMTEGDMGTDIFFIKTGGVNVFRRNNQDDDVYLTMLGRGTHFGESILFLERPRISTVKAATDSEFAVVNRDDFMNWLESNPSVSHRVLMEICRENFERMYEVGQELAYMREGSMGQDEIDKLLH